MTNIEAITAKPATSERRAKAALRKAAAGLTTTAAEHAWTEAAARYWAARAQVDANVTRANELYLLLDAAVPCPPEAMNADGDLFDEREILALKDKTAIEKLAILQTREAYLQARYSHPLWIEAEKPEEGDASHAAFSEAKRDLLALQPANAPPIMSRVNSRTCFAFARSDIGDIMTELARQGIGSGAPPCEFAESPRSAYEVFMAQLRLFDPASPILEVETFDRQAWTEEFEAFPGHELTGAGARWASPQAYGAPPSEVFQVTIPALVDRHNEAMAAHQRAYGQPKAVFVYLHGRQEIEDQLRDYPQERDRLLALWEQHQAAVSGPPLGRHLWKELPEWKRIALRIYGAFHDGAKRVAQDVLDNFSFGVFSAGEVEAVMQLRHKALPPVVIREGLRRAEASGLVYGVGPATDTPADCAA